MGTPLSKGTLRASYLTMGSNEKVDHWDHEDTWLELDGTDTDFSAEWLRGPNRKLVLPSGLLVLTARWTGEL
jgi:hypothetical protein